MPIYYVYDSQSGEIVQRHEAYSIADDSSMQCSDDEILALVDVAFKSRSLQILEVETAHPAERTLDGLGLYVDPSTRTLARRDSS
jgi:hypothetical protein